MTIRLLDLSHTYWARHGVEDWGLVVDADEEEIDEEDLIQEENVCITLTHLGYVKRVSADTYKAQKRGGKGITGLTRRDEDFVEELFICFTVALR